MSNIKDIAFEIVQNDNKIYPKSQTLLQFSKFKHYFKEEFLKFEKSKLKDHNQIINKRFKRLLLSSKTTFETDHQSKVQELLSKVKERKLEKMKKKLKKSLKKRTSPHERKIRPIRKTVKSQKSDSDTSRYLKEDSDEYSENSSEIDNIKESSVEDDVSLPELSITEEENLSYIEAKKEKSKEKIKVKKEKESLTRRNIQEKAPEIQGNLDKDGIEQINDEMFSIITNTFKGKKYHELDPSEAESIIYNLRCKNGKVYQAGIPKFMGNEKKIVSYFAGGAIGFGKFSDRRLHSYLKSPQKR